MAVDPTAGDLKTLWQDQERELDPMTLDQIHTLVRRNDRRMQRSGLMLAVTLLLVGAVGMLGWIKNHDPVLTVLFVGGELTACFLMYRIAFPARDPAEAAGAYLRRRLQGRLDHLQGRWVFALAPLLPVIAWTGYVLSQHHETPLARRLTPFVLLVVTIVFVAFRTRSRARKVKAELDELDSLLRR